MWPVPAPLTLLSLVLLTRREKHSLEQDIREKEEAIRQKTTEVQVGRPGGGLVVGRGQWAGFVPGPGRWGLLVWLMGGSLIPMPVIQTSSS